MLKKCSLNQNDKKPNVTSIISLYFIQLFTISYFLLLHNSIFQLYYLPLKNVITLLYLISLFSFCIIIVKLLSLYFTQFLLLEISIYIYIIYLIIQYYLFYHLSISFFVFDSPIIKTLSIPDLILLSVLLFSFINTSIDLIVTVLSILHSFLPSSEEKKEEIIDEGNLTCAICLNEIEDNEKFSCEDIVRLRCHPKHKFHMKCMTAWCKKNFSCPICKASII